MTINRTTLLDLPLPVTGTEPNTWGDVVNYGLTEYLDISIAGSLDLSTDADVLLASTEGTAIADNIGATTAQYAVLRCTGSRTVTRNITAPAWAISSGTLTDYSKTYIVVNETTGGQNIVLRATNSVTPTYTTGVTIVPGERAVCVWNGSDFVKAGGVIGGSNTQVQYNNAGVLGGIANATSDGTTLSMTSPKVITGINDTNGNELLKVTATGSAVNELTLANAATGNAPTLSATGDDTNIGINITPKGSGVVTISNLAVTTIDATNIEVTNIKAKDGTAAGSIADSTGVVTLGSSVLTTTDINGGTIDGTAIGANSASTGAFTTLSASSTVTLSGGTANGVLYLNGSKVATSGSALTFDGTTATTPRLALGGTTLPAAGTATLFSRSSDNNTYLQTGSGNSFVVLDGSQNTMFEASPTLLGFNINNSEQMRLTSTGLGIGTSSPAAKLHVNGDIRIADSSSLLMGVGAEQKIFVAGSANNTYLTFNQWTGSAYTERMRLDSSGNLGLGVTPSAWGTASSRRAIELPGGGNIWGQNFGGSNPSMQVYCNAYESSTGARYVNSAHASGYQQNAGSHAWFTAPSGTAGNAITFTQAMTLDASGNLGVGTTSPGGKIACAVASSGTFQNAFVATNGVDSEFIARIKTNVTEIANGGSSGVIAFATGGSLTERARITSGGDFLIGQTSVFSNPTIVAVTGGNVGFASRHTSSAAGKYFYFGADQNNAYIVYNQSGTGVYLTDGGTSWTASSDERVKEIIEPITNAAQKVSTLRAVIGKYKSDKEGTRRSFLIAQDVQAVLPEAVNIQEDEIGTLGVQYTDTIPLLVAAIKEQQALIQSLTTRVALLEGTQP